MKKEPAGDIFIKKFYNSAESRKSAFPAGGQIKIQLFVKNGICPLAAYFYMGGDGGVFVSERMAEEGENGGYNVYSYSRTAEKPGLFFFHAEIETENGRKYTRYDGLDCGLDDKFNNEWQLTFYEEIYGEPRWFGGGAIYHIFIDRFNRDGADYNAERRDWIPEYPRKQGDFYKNNSFFGGTIRGITEKLGYLQQLSVSCVYLSPVFEAYSNHKYDVGDYMKTDEAFGGDGALTELAAEAGKRGIKIILDGVFNHVGDDSVYFDKYGRYGGGAYGSANSPYRGWFSFGKTDDEYDCWWGLRNLPKVDPRNGFGDFICSQVIPKYMDMGVSGWRLDVADELESGFLEKITETAKKIKKDAYIAGEVWEDASNKISYGARRGYFLGRQLDAVTNYPLRNAIIDFIVNKDSYLLRRTLNTIYENYPDRVLRGLMNFLGTHDTVRIINALSGINTDGKTNAELSVLRLTPRERAAALKKVKNAYTILVFMPGIPCIYYGDETGLEGWNDPFNRMPFDWAEADGELAGWFKTVNKTRKENALHTADGLEIYDWGEKIFAAKRYGAEGEFLLISNSGEQPFPFREGAVGPGDAEIFKRTDKKWIKLI